MNCSMKKQQSRSDCLVSAWMFYSAHRQAMPEQSRKDDLSASELTRRKMVSEQLVARGLVNQRVLDAVSAIPREQFVPKSARDSAYHDSAMPIGHGQTISQPYTVAFMCEALDPQPTDRILEIGTGSGYGAAVLSKLVHHVDTVERIPELAEAAALRLKQLLLDNVSVHVADGTLGLEGAGPFNGIIATAGGKQLPESLIRQLKDGGRIVIPLGDTLRSQTMWRFTRKGDDMVAEDLGKFAFVPLIGVEGWDESVQRRG